MVDFRKVREAVESAYDACKGMSGGKNASYIPFLADVDPSLFGMSVVLPSGESFSIGDTSYVFGVESVSKVPTAILAMRQHGPEAILERIGADATGLRFNSIFAMLLENDHPPTPLVNSGAITACSMIEPKGDPEAKWTAIVDNMTDLMGSEPKLLAELYESESSTNFENRSIAWLLKSYDRIYDDPMESLDLYTRQCSLGVTCDQLAIAAATIANDGLNPVTGKRAFDAGYAPKVVSLIATVGFYERTGDWMYEAGIPGKTGVGGGIMAMMPGEFGIAAFSPPLDEHGNSVKAQAAIKHTMGEIGMNVYGAR